MALLLVLFSNAAVLALENMAVQDIGRQDLANSDVRYVTVIETDPQQQAFMLWYEDLSVTQGSSLFWSSFSAGTDGFTKDGEATAFTFNLQVDEGLYGRPSVFKTNTGFGMYLWRNDQLYYASSSDGKEWTTPTTVQGISNVAGAVDLLHMPTGEVYLYWVDIQGKLFLSVSTSYTEFTGMPQAILGDCKFLPTGQVLPGVDATDDSELYYFFFTTPEPSTFAGLAVSKDGRTGWKIIRGFDSEPLLSYSNSSESRETLRDLSVTNGGATYNLFYTAKFNDELQMSTLTVSGDSGERNSVGFAKGRPATVHVRPNGAKGHAKTIQEGADSVKEGGRVVVRQATYSEFVHVNKPVTIIAEDPLNWPVVQFSGASGNIFKITADNVTVKNITFSGNNDTRVPVTVSGAGNTLLEEVEFKEYGGLALLAENVKNTVVVKKARWSTYNPSTVVSGDVFIDGIVLKLNTDVQGNMTDSDGILSLSPFNYGSYIEVIRLTSTALAGPPNVVIGSVWDIVPENKVHPEGVVISVKSSQPTANTRLYHYNDATGKWEDITLRPGDEQYPLDAKSGYVYGLTYSFSPFLEGQAVNYNSYGTNTNGLIALAGLLFISGTLALKEKRYNITG